MLFLSVFLPKITDMSHTMKFKGTGVAIVTPFDSQGEVDYKSLEKLVEHLINGKVEYLVVLGTTGESATLSKEEKKKLVEYVVEKVNKRVPVVIGIGGNNTREVVETIKTTDFTGIDAILSVSPYYNKPTQAGIYEHYKAIANESKLPIILYNVPGRTNSNITAETTLKLADIINIIGIKEASGNLEQIMKIAKYKPKDFLVISGDDNLTLPTIACGGEGVISVVANAFPFIFSEMVRKAMQNKMEEARELHFKLIDITDQLFADGNPGGIKAALEIMNICENNLRLPLVPVNANVHNKLKELIGKVN